MLELSKAAQQPSMKLSVKLQKAFQEHGWQGATSYSTSDFMESKVQEF